MALAHSIVPTVGIYKPEFPTDSPWATSVGGTMFGDKKTNIEIGQVWLDNSLGSGGGFSNRFERPAWQDAAISAWSNISKSENKLPSDSSWSNRTGRAYSDVSTLANSV